MSEPFHYDRPVLVLDPGTHTALIRRADTDAAGRVAVTASEDKTLRLWSLTDGKLLRVIRLPGGPGVSGMLYAVAMSPDGKWIAAGGFIGRGIAPEVDLAVLVFDAGTGGVVARIERLPAPPGHLAFSADGRKLAIALNSGGLHLYARGPEGDWLRVAADLDFGGSSYGVAFAPDGRIAAACSDGILRLYAGDGAPLRRISIGASLYAVAFNPVDGRLAVGCLDAPNIALFERASLDAIPSPAGSDREGLAVCALAWSKDGASLFAAGTYEDEEGTPVFAWLDRLDEPPRVLRAGTTTVMSLVALPDGRVFAAAADPWLGVIERDGELRWSVSPAKADARGQKASLAASADGMLVEFDLRPKGERRRMDLAALKLTPPQGEGGVRPPVQEGIAVTGWSEAPPLAVGGRALALAPHEVSRSMAVHPDLRRFVIGADWTLRAFDSSGAELWMRDVSGPVWAVNIAGEGRHLVAAYGDGTLRWHRVEDGAELLALFPLQDGEDWVAWTPEGVYAATTGARRVLRWHVNHGWDQAAEAIPVEAIPETHRPEVIRHVLPQMGTAGAIAVAELAKIRGAVQRATGAEVTPGARLHVLAIGVSDYGAAARHLDLAYADQDARDVAAALRDSQGGLYARVLPSVLVNAEATRAAILSELNALAAAMQAGGGQDVAVVLFSGHGEMVDEDEFYLLPHGVDASGTDALVAAALPATQFHDRIARVARHGRVILFLDACFSGGATAPLDRSLRAMLAAPNLSVFASASPRENSLERSDWQNGALAEALLAALREADEDHDGLIRISDLSRFLAERIPGLTAGDQHPEVEIRFDRKVLAAML